MTLRELLGDGPEVEVSGLAYDNRAVVPGTLFFCVPGFTRDGHDFAPDAVARGAAALVVQRPLGLGVPELLVGDVRAAMARAAARMHGDPTAELPVVGITGTSGKTTTTHVVRHLLEAGGRRCGLLGGVTAVIGGEQREAVRTTPEAIDLQAPFREMLDAGDRACAMEVSSHALELRRVDGIHFAAAAFTNLSQDHLDFHPDMESYFATKLRLFEEFDVGRSIVVVDDAWGRRIAERLAGATTVSLDRAADWRALELRVRRRSSCRCAAASTWRTRSSRWRRAKRSGSSWARWRTRCSACRRSRAASSPSTRARTSPSWSTTRTSRARLRRCSSRRASSRAAACSSSSVPAATAIAPSAP